MSFLEGSFLGAIAKGRARLAVGIIQVFALLFALAPGPVATAQEGSTPSETQPETSPPQSGEEVVELRTENSRTVVGEDGNLEAQVYSGPIHYRDDENDWARIDNTLVPSERPGYAYENAANSFTVFIPDDIADMPIRVEAGDEWVTYALEGASGVPSVTADTATFSDTLTGVDLSYTVLSSGVREDLELASPATPDLYDFEVDMSSGLEAQERTDETISFSDSSGKQFSFASPVMYEESSGEATTAISQEIIGDESADDDFTLRLDPSDNWLDSDQRDYPVVVDPEWISWDADQARSCWIGNGPGEANQGYCYQDEIRVGYYSTDSAKRRGSLQYNLPTFIQGGDVLDAKLRMCVTARSTTNVVTMKAHQSTENSTHDVTWNRRNITNGSNVLWTNPGGTFATSSSDPEQSIGGGVGRYETMDVDPGVKDWLNGTQTNHGWILKTGEATNQVVRFASFNYPASGGSGVTTDCNDGKKPRLTIEFNRAPHGPTDLSPATDSITNDATPALTATYNDPDTGDTGYTEFEVLDAESFLVASGRSPGSPSNVSPATSVMWSPSENLLEGPYTWKARNCDGGRCSDWTSPRVLNVTPPDVPVLLTEPYGPSPDATPEWEFVHDSTFLMQTGTIFECRLDNSLGVVSSYTSCTPPITFDLTSLGNGSYTLLVRERDGSGNVSDAVTDTYDYQSGADTPPSPAASCALVESTDPLIEGDVADPGDCDQQELTNLFLEDPHAMELEDTQGNSQAGPFKPFNPGTYWRKKIGGWDEASLSTEILAEIKAKSDNNENYLHLAGTQEGATGNYGMPFYFAKPSDPDYFLDCEGCPEGFPEYVDLPNGAEPMGGPGVTDSAMTIFNRTGNASTPSDPYDDREYALGLYEVTVNHSSSPRVLTATRGDIYRLDSGGIAASWGCCESASSGNVGHRGMPSAVSGVRWREVRFGAIEHALKVAMPVTAEKHCFPATTHEHGKGGLEIQEGTRLKLKSSIKGSKLKNKVEKARAQPIAIAMREYGIVVGDTSDDFPVLKLENLAVNPAYSDESWRSPWMLGADAADVFKELPFTKEYWVVKKKGYDGNSDHGCIAHSPNE